MSFVFEIIVEIIFVRIILGFFKLLGKGFGYLKRKILGLPPKPLDPFKKLEKTYLNKEIVLTESINPKIKKGQLGAVLEIIDNDAIYAEFYNGEQDQIEYNEDIVFKIKFGQFQLTENKKSI